MVALQARELAAQGYAVLIPDLQGCGDSSGDFAEARWEQWVCDLVLASDWMRVREAAPLWLWGLRSGCLLAAQAVQHLHAPANLLLWSPTPSGRQTVQQFLRLAAASDLMSGNSKATLERLRQQIAHGECVEIAGYLTSGALLQAMEQAAMRPDPRPGRLLCFDVSTQPNAGLSPATAKFLELWREVGHSVQAETVQGPSFWQTTEIEEAPQLVAATTAAMKHLMRAEQESR